MSDLISAVVEKAVPQAGLQLETRLHPEGKVVHRALPALVELAGQAVELQLAGMPASVDWPEEALELQLVGMLAPVNWPEEALELQSEETRVPAD